MNRVRWQHKITQWNTFPKNKNKILKKIRLSRITQHKEAAKELLSIKPKIKENPITSSDVW